MRTTRLRLILPAALMALGTATPTVLATETGTAPPAPYEEFDGTLDEFYVVPDPLPAGEPGDSIRVQTLATTRIQTGVRIMYHSTDESGVDRAVTGVVYFPAGEVPEGGWPVLASAHGTSGIAERCAPSRAPLEPAAFGVEGVRVATDYIGLGPVGELHAYLSAAAEGNAVIDSVRAVHALLGDAVRDDWVAFGHSQGGHAALITNERAAERMPEYPLLGTVAAAPGAQFGESYGDDVQLRIITTMVLFGAAAENPAIDPADYLNPEAFAAAETVVHDGCLGEIIDTMLPFAATPDFYVQDPMTATSGPAHDWLVANNPGQVVSESPLLLLQGGKDPIVVPARTEALYDQLCSIGQVVEYVDIPEADHGTELPLGEAQISAWLAGRLAGEPATSTCPA